jgi:hypothetical protein
MLPEVGSLEGAPSLTKEYSSGDDLMNKEQVRELLIRNRLMIGDELVLEGELLR